MPVAQRKQLVTSLVLAAAVLWYGTFQSLININQQTRFALQYWDKVSDHRPSTHWKHTEAGILFTNLPQHAARLSHINKLVRDIGFDPIRFDSACPDCANLRGKMFSHLRFLKRVASEAHDRYVIILEDDVELSDRIEDRRKFGTILEEEMRQWLRPDGSDGFVRLGACLTEDLSKRCTPRECAAFCTHAYMVNPWGARKLLKDLRRRYHKKLRLRKAQKWSGPSMEQMLNETIAPPLLGWDYTTEGGRGLFYKARKAPWHGLRSRPSSLHVSIAHEPRYDMLGSFIAPTVYLFAVANYHGWELEVIPFTGSSGEKRLKENLAKGDKLGWEESSGLQDTTFREHYDPIQVNTDSCQNMGFFSCVSNSSVAYKDWIGATEVPLPGVELEDKCRKRKVEGDGQCRIRLTDDTFAMQRHMERMGGYDAFFPLELREQMRRKFLDMNGHRLKYYGQGHNIAIHVRRGDVISQNRLISQPVYAAVASRICKSNPGASIHIFSAGPNRDGNWTELESLSVRGCGNVVFHLDELEFDTWTHMAASDALILSKSAFSVIPALFCSGEVHYPHGFWHPRLSHWNYFDTTTGDPVA